MKSEFFKVSDLSAIHVGKNVDVLQENSYNLAQSGMLLGVSRDGKGSLFLKFGAEPLAYSEEMAEKTRVKMYE